MKHDSRITARGPALDASVLGRLAALKAMTVKELKAEWQALFGTPAPNNSRAFLAMRIGYRIQELTYGGPDRDTRGLPPVNGSTCNVG